ncbi:MAG: hypothetical protein ACOQNV_00185 [Mycoplasmoidaceae bacterium]
MKKTKLLMPILGVGAVAATVAPVAAMTGCTKVEIGEFSIAQKGPTQQGDTNFKLKLTWNEFEKESKNEIVVQMITGSIILGEEHLTFADLTADCVTISKELNEQGYSDIKISFEEGKEIGQIGTYKGNLTLKYTEGGTEPITYKINGFDVVVSGKQ